MLEDESGYRTYVSTRWRVSSRRATEKAAMGARRGRVMDGISGVGMLILSS